MPIFVIIMLGWLTDLIKKVEEPIFLLKFCKNKLK